MLVSTTLANAGDTDASFHQAALRGDMSALRQLHGEGVNVDTRNKDGQTVLVAAILARQSDVAGWLIDNGADIQARTGKGLTPLHAAAYAGDFDTAVKLVKKEARVSDAENDFAITALHAAVEEKNSDIVELLLASGVDTKVTERGGYTALTRALFADHMDVGRLLVRAGATCQPEAVLGPELYALCSKIKP